MNKYYSYDKALLHLQKYCALQERCHHEVYKKLYELKVYGEEAEQILHQLIKDDFVNELRFAIEFARGKHRQKNWGKEKIRKELIGKNISHYCINKAIQELEDDAYNIVLDKLVEKKFKLLSSTLSPREKKIKLALFARSKGFESELIWELLNKKIHAQH